MKNGDSSLFLGWLLAFIAPAALAQQAPLVAPVYPASLLVAEPAKTTQPVVYLSRDEHEKVQAFYVPAHARLPKPNEGMNKGASRVPLIVKDGKTVQSMMVKAKLDYTWARATEVNLEWRPEVMAEGSAARRLFMLMEGGAKKDPSVPARVAAARKQYAWLELAFFKEGDEERIFARCTREWPMKGQGANSIPFLTSCLEEMARVGGLTRISIDRDPMTWK